MEEPAGADPDARHFLAGDELHLLEGHEWRRRRRAVPVGVRSGRRGDLKVGAVRRRVQQEVRQLPVLRRLHRL